MIKIDEMQTDVKIINQSNETTMAEHMRRINFHDTTFRNIEVQLGQVAQEIRKKPQGGLPSDLVANPKGNEQCCAISVKGEITLESNVEERGVSERSSMKRYDVIREVSIAYSMDRASAHKEVRRSMKRYDVIEEESIS